MNAIFYNVSAWFKSLDIIAQLQIAEFYSTKSGFNDDITQGLTDDAEFFLAVNYKNEILGFVADKAAPAVQPTDLKKKIAELEQALESTLGLSDPKAATLLHENISLFKALEKSHSYFTQIYDRLVNLGEESEVLAEISLNLAAMKEAMENPFSQNPIHINREMVDALKKISKEAELEDDDTEEGLKNSMLFIQKLANTGIQKATQD
jgi:hypothetical protein